MEPHEIDSPYVVIGVGAAGLLVNLLGHGQKSKTCKSEKPNCSSSQTNRPGVDHNSPNGVNAGNRGYG
ncbi:hypothetical protein NHX12_026396 [Muraenolepis orangiensis]|uniref:Uncharacterized protein n=1 Tax=Muraenolepis orangiensis TaxID=630683 RepID=A0A9Q0EIJ0_9TELE|nr:hypothetical protein NHX12_026396 [Muraenolepis orangiensis]